ncbi:MAG: hypothetical protein ACRYF0_14290 [Janthinobacterium lividum]
MKNPGREGSPAYRPRPALAPCRQAAAQLQYPAPCPASEWAQG